MTGIDAAETLTWGPRKIRRWMSRGFYVIGVATLVLGVGELISDSHPAAAIRLLTGAFLVAEGWLLGAERTTADPRGIRHRMPGVARWADVRVIRPNAPHPWAEHVVVETADGAMHRLESVPAGDVDRLTRLWRESAAERSS